MPSLRALALLVLGALAAHLPAALRVIRVTPLREAAPFAEISVTFDRPVAGSLDRSADPPAILTRSPVVRGAIDWRDPVTLRLRPAAPLAPGTTYAITVSGGFTAMDRSRLPEPYRFSFRVTGPRILSGVGVSGAGSVQFLTPTPGSSWC